MPTFSPSTAYIICAGPRTGSNLLSTALRHTTIAGLPYEYFEAAEADQPYMREMLGVPEGVEFSNFSDRLDLILRAGTTANGVFGTVVHWYQLDQLLGAVESNGGDASAPPVRRPGSLRAFFPKLRFIRLRRENKVAQGISHYVAIKTNRWQVRTDDFRSTLDGATETAFDFAEIDHQVEDAGRIDQGWGEFLEDAKDLTLELFYEELAADFHGVLNRVLDHLGLSLGTLRRPAPRYRKQSGARSQAWEARYIQEKCDLVRAQSALFIDNSHPGRSRKDDEMGRHES